MRRQALLVVIALVVYSSACSSLSRRAVAGVDDYAQYRRVRTAQTLTERLRESWKYLRDFPEGEWQGEVTAWFRVAEGRFVTAAWDSPSQLSTYLELMPDGPRASLVERRISLLQAQTAKVRAEDRRLLADAKEREAFLRQAALDREQFVRELAQWVSQLSAIRSFGQRTHFLPLEFLHAWRDIAPRAKCQGNVCKKELNASFQIPEDGELAPRLALYDVVVQLRDGVVELAEIRGPELFSRLGEAVLKRAAPASDLQARTEALAASAQVIAVAVESAMPAQSCRQSVISPRVLVRECAGHRLEMVASMDGTAEDRISVYALETPQGQLPAAAAADSTGGSAGGGAGAVGGMGGAASFAGSTAGAQPN